MLPDLIGIHPYYLLFLADIFDLLSQVDQPVNDHRADDTDDEENVYILENPGDRRSRHPGSTVDGSAGDRFGNARMAIAAGFLQIGGVN